MKERAAPQPMAGQLRDIASLLTLLYLRLSSFGSQTTFGRASVRLPLLHGLYLTTKKSTHYSV